MNSENVKFGVSGAETTDGSCALSIEKSKELENFLKDSNFYETEEEGKTREKALGMLNKLLRAFVAEMASLRGESNSGGKISTFGSYRLGVHGKSADIDTLCVVPRFVSRKDFFDKFYSKLKEDPHTKEVTKIEEAYVPLIKLKYFNIPIDLTFARIPLMNVDASTNMLDETLLKSMDEKCILSLNGSRVTDTMLNLVPNIEVFHGVLKAIKLWAKHRNVYGNTFGFFGGVAFSISTARICQMFPNFSTFDVFKKYFEVYSKWKWPQPVILKPIVDYHYNLKNWDPVKHPADRFHKMPVITPIYPSMCATHNVSKSTSLFFIKEMQRAYDILEKTDCSLSQVFQKTSFFRKFTAFIKVEISCADENEFQTWCGYVESRVRVLAAKLEVSSDIESAVPLPRSFQTTTSAFYFIGLEILKYKNITRKVYIDEFITEFLEYVNEWSDKTLNMKINISAVKKNEIKSILRKYFASQKN